MKTFKDAVNAINHHNQQNTSHYDDYMTALPMEAIHRHAKYVKAVILALKIGLGSALSVLLAKWLGLGSAVSAGTITLLTLSNSKQGTLSLIGQRFLSFGVSVALCVLLFSTVDNDYLAYTFFLFGLSFICELLDWGKTLSVNAVIGAHFFDRMSFDLPFLWNEFELILLAVSIAFVFNLFYAYNTMRLDLFSCRIASEQHLHNDLLAIADYLDGEGTRTDLRSRLEKSVTQDVHYLEEARGFAGNFYSKAPHAFIDYFEMRIAQQNVLRALLPSLEELREVPQEAAAIARYIRLIVPYISKLRAPVIQMAHMIMMESHMLEASPVAQHVLMAMKDLMTLKMDFLNTMEQKEVDLFFKNLSSRYGL